MYISSHLSRYNNNNSNISTIKVVNASVAKVVVAELIPRHTRTYYTYQLLLVCCF